MALGLGITPIARVSSRDPHDAARILDCGAQGVMVPHVSTVAEPKAVESCLYPPLGHGRPRGPDRRSVRRLAQAEINTYLDEQTLLNAMLQTPIAYAAVGGIDIKT